MKTKNTFLALLTLCISGSIFAEKKLYLQNNFNQTLMYNVVYEEFVSRNTNIYAGSVATLKYGQILPSLLNISHATYTTAKHITDTQKSRLSQLDKLREKAVQSLQQDTNPNAVRTIVINPDLSLSLQAAPPRPQSLPAIPN